MRCIELFAGAGGAALGLEAAGIVHAALCEWDADACATLRAAGLWPVVEGDVRDLDAIEAVARGVHDPECDMDTDCVCGVEENAIDLLWSSFPCQAFSVAGKRLGASDERNGWPWTVDAIDRFRPRWFLGENVRGLLFHSSEGCGNPMACARCYLDGVILPQLRERFTHAGWFLLNAADFGVPQHRRRVILWAGPRPIQAPKATHADPAALAQTSLFGDDRRPWVSMGEALGISDAAIQHRAHGVRGFRTVMAGAPAPTVLAGSHNETGFRITETTASLAASAPEALALPSSTVLARAVKGSTGDRAIQRRGIGGASDSLYVATGRRQLTIEEAARLQDFPTGHPWQGNKAQRFRQIGNAVPPTLARVVAEAVIATDESTTTHEGESMKDEKKRGPGRPMKGQGKRTAMLPRVEPRVRDMIKDAALLGETMADTITRWAEEQS